MTEFLPGFDHATIETEPGVSIHARSAGRGSPILLLHGHPQTSSTWHAVAPALAEHHRVVLMDLRGYGASAKPPSGPDHATYSKRAMAQDAVSVMRALGHARFAIVGHDRGGRVAHRLAMDHPDAVERIAVLDIAPTLHMYETADRRFAEAYFWWFFLIQPEPLPERLIGADPEFFLRHHLAQQSRTAGVPAEPVIREYLRHYDDPAAIHAICEDYRAASTIDLVHDRADRETGRRVMSPLLALWGAEGTVGKLYDVLDTWRAVASDVRGRALACGHLLQEERPDETLAELRAFLAG
jgi:haloacetate dehalogenase